MPVKIETWEFDDFLIEELFPDEPIMEPVLSDDIWKKFEIDYPELTGIAEMLLQEEQSLINDTKDIEAQQGCLIPGLTPVANPVVISGVVAPEIVTPSVVTPAVVTPALVTPVVVTPAVVIPPNNRGNNTSNPSVQVTSANPPASLPASPASGSPPSSLSEIRNHDCMWAGSCFYGRHGQGGCQGSSEGGCQRPKENGGFLKPGPVMNRCPPQPPLNAFIKKEEPDDEQYYQQAQYQHHQTSRSVLKPAVRAAVKQQQQQQQHMPQTPPMSDDEEGKSKPSKVLSLLTNDPISPTEYSSDTELCEYLQEEIEDEEEEEEEGDEEEQDEEEIRRLEAVNAAAAVKLEEMADRAVRVKAAAEIDHSYHKGKGSDQMMQEYLGLETPSDSEEEIDVVSVVDKLSFTINNRVSTLPNNPSTRDKQHIQRRVATAISRKRIPNSAGKGIKTILPVRKNAHSLPETSTSTKRKGATTSDCRNAKRPRKYKSGYNTPYKRRMYGNSSDSEQEPSEKRNLHNNMERQRRIDLRNAFEDLRQLIPEVSKKDRAAKVLILKEASQYCDHLTRTSVNQQKHMEDLKRHQEWLRNRVSQLRRSLAAKR